jgi:TonB-dependent Receptor Plug Domain
MRRGIAGLGIGASTIAAASVTLAQTATQTGTTLPTVVVEAPSTAAKFAPRKSGSPQNERRLPVAKRTPAAPASQIAPSVPLSAPAVGNPTSWPPSVDAIAATHSAIGQAPSASAGTIGVDRLAAHTPFRPAEILETVPGLVVTQHSGEGKANQYYLRGFNLDHGTDIAIVLDGMPLNMPSHGHGQGYADANFMIPELVRGLQFYKGPYYASEGNFSSAGAIHADYVDKLDRNIGQVELGSFGYRRAFGAMSAPTGSSNS